jgi:hypothetical protein
MIKQKGRKKSSLFGRRIKKKSRNKIKKNNKESKKNRNQPLRLHYCLRDKKGSKANKL